MVAEGRGNRTHRGIHDPATGFEDRGPHQRTLPSVNLILVASHAACTGGRGRSWGML